MLFELSPQDPGDQLGHALARFPDADADGYPELLVAARGRRVELRSGMDGAVYRYFLPPMPLATFGSSIDAAGDVDADGVPDVIVGAYELVYSPLCYEGCIALTPGRAYVYSGADGSVLHELGEQFGSDWEFGWAVAGVGDVDGDGHDDVAVGAPATYYAWHEAPGHVTVFSGADGTPLWTVTGASDVDQFGSSLARLADRDGDGVDELAVGANGGIGPMGQVAAYVSVRSGATGAELLHAELDWFGQSLQVRPIGDVDGDGVEDLGATLEVYSGLGTSWGQGQFTQVSGQDGRVLRLSVPAIPLGIETWGFGLGLAGGEDVDGDGAPDVALGCASRGAVGVVRADGSALGVHGGLLPATPATLLVDVRAGVPLLLPDRTGDGRAELVIGESWAPGGGRVTVIAGGPPAWADAGPGTSGGLAGLVPSLTPLGTLVEGLGVAFQVRSVPFERYPLGASPGRLVVGTGALPMPFAGGTLVPVPDVLLPFSASPFLGQTAASFTVPPGLPAGMELYVQAIVAAPPGSGPPLLSNAVRSVVP